MNKMTIADENSRIQCQPFLRSFPLGRFSIVLSKSEGNMGCRVVSVAERTVVGLSVGFALRVWRWAGGLA